MTGVEFPLPRRMPPREQAAMITAAFHEWRLDGDDGAWLSFYRQDDGFLLRFPELADFRIAPDGSTATCWPVPGTDDGTLEHLFLNQVMPMMQSAAGHLVLHAGVVEMPTARDEQAQGGQGLDAKAAIAFLGRSGRGKSTLTASFALSGARFLTDDMLVVERGPNGVIAQPSHPSIRMWRDSRDAVLGDNVTLAPAVSYTDKGRLLAAENLLHCPDPLPLRAAFFLGDDTPEQPSFRRLGGAAALAA